MLEVVPRQWKVIQTVREKITCRACEKITQSPAPFHTIARGRAGPGLLAMVLHAKFGHHLPLNRQSESFAREGIDLDVSTLADWVGAWVATLKPLIELIQGHVMSGARLHGDDTTVPVLAKTRTTTGRLWTYVREDRPFGGRDPLAALFYYSPEGVHPRRHLASYAGILQADAYAGFGDLYEPSRRPGPITEAACWSHGQRKFFILADVAKAVAARAQTKQAAWSPMAGEAVRRIDLIFGAERALNGVAADQRLELRRTHVARRAPALELAPRCRHQSCRLISDGPDCDRLQALRISPMLACHLPGGEEPLPSVVPVEDADGVSPTFPLARELVADRLVALREVVEFGAVALHVVEFPIAAELPHQLPIAKPHRCVALVLPEDWLRPVPVRAIEQWQQALAVESLQCGVTGLRWVGDARGGEDGRQQVDDVSWGVRNPARPDAARPMGNERRRDAALVNPMLEEAEGGV
jgi:transposase